MEEDHSKCFGCLGNCSPNSDQGPDLPRRQQTPGRAAQCLISLARRRLEHTGETIVNVSPTVSLFFAFTYPTK